MSLVLRKKRPCQGPEFLRFTHVETTPHRISLRNQNSPNISWRIFAVRRATTNLVTILTVLLALTSVVDACTSFAPYLCEETFLVMGDQLEKSITPLHYFFRSSIIGIRQTLREVFKKSIFCPTTPCLGKRLILGRGFRARL